MQDAPSRVTVIHEEKVGIPYARNAAVDWALAAGAECHIFIDDDVQPDHEWHRNLLSDFRESNADVMQGATIFRYPDDYPNYYPRIPDRRFSPDTKLVTGSTANVIFRTAPIKVLNLRFNVDLAEYGGSDADFFFQLHLNGATILHSPNAVVLEPLIGFRTSLLWQARRRIRTSQSWFYAIGGITPEGDRPISRKGFGLVLNAVRILGRFVSRTFFLLVAPVRGRKSFLQAFMDLMPILAVLLTAMGIRIREYKR